MKIQEIKNVIVGSGAAGYAAALRLKQYGETDFAIVTENVNAGTSRNTGSDKQTYYKLSLASSDLDSVCAMAKDLFAGQCVDGDQALCEAALSTRGFYNLVELGVPFPCTEYGEYMGYKTDHDCGRRATSAGPYTSKTMVECLEKEIQNHEIRILDKLQVIKILVEDGTVYGILCLDKSKKEDPYLLIWCTNLVWATGGPAGMYHDSVYPGSQLGASGIAFKAGVKGKNLTEWQFGMASVNPRWNVSGTYMQVLPRFVSTDQNGNDEKEFLNEYFKTQEEQLSMIFLKGYQWPFDVNKIFGGSSVIDLLVYQETILKNRKVYLDFRENSGKADIHFDKLAAETYEYLQKAHALIGKPIDRLEKMNAPAIQFFLDHGVNLKTEMLEIAICAQHNNGGLSTDAHWETNIKGLFAIGEVCGSHGVTRPGGTALNSGQVGAIRAAECIHYNAIRKPAEENSKHYDEVKQKEYKTIKMCREKLIISSLNYVSRVNGATGKQTVRDRWIKDTKRMSSFCGMIRNEMNLSEVLAEINQELEDFNKIVQKPDIKQLSFYYRLYDMIIAQKVYVSAMMDYCQKGIGSRGSALYTDVNGKLPEIELPELFKCILDNSVHGNVIQEIQLKDGECQATWREVRPLPKVDYFFENQWKMYRARIYGN